jgi:hypothetical protein
VIKQCVVALAFLAATGCDGAEPRWSEPHHMLSQVNIHAPQSVQVAVIEATKKFGERYGYQVDASNNLPREGRQVMQVLLTRSDGVMIVTDNFMNADTLDTGFYAKKENADWRTAKEEWLKEVRAVVGKQGNIVDVILEKEPTHK